MGCTAHRLTNPPEYILISNKCEPSNTHTHTHTDRPADLISAIIASAKPKVTQKNPHNFKVNSSAVSQISLLLIAALS